MKIIAVDTAVIYNSIFRCRVLRSSNDGAKGKGGLGWSAWSCRKNYGEIVTARAEKKIYDTGIVYNLCSAEFANDTR